MTRRVSNERLREIPEHIRGTGPHNDWTDGEVQDLCNDLRDERALSKRLAAACEAVSKEWPRVTTTGDLARLAVLIEHARAALRDYEEASK